MRFFNTRFASACLLGFLSTTAVVIALPSSASEVVHQFEFGGEPGVPARKALASRDFVLKQDAEDERKISLYHSEDALHIQVTKPPFGCVL